jgi:cytochrome c553
MKKEHKRDLLILAIGVAIVAFLWAAPEETTTHIPSDDAHKLSYELVQKEGKKAAEAHCEECHNDDGVQFPVDHPPKFRCLFCHKLNN